jgi:hypothetical protein
METLQTKKEKAIDAYKKGSESERKLLENMFGAETFRDANIMDQVKTFEDACKVLGVRPGEVINGTEDTDEAAYKKIKVIVRALNEGWKPDWTNDDEYKYYPWFNLSSGSGLSYGDYVDRYSISSVGSRLCFKSSELAEYAGKQFIDLYTDYFIIKP